ncbi:hypothetical protein ACSVDE_18850 [Pseudalkalibacillus sp. Hm43]|uniref:hypothetical protein n=1 Tax=Pseudalkalibacillus sp. Hm43 TaxID=3450742 RepID=UPI003F422460
MKKMYVKMTSALNKYVKNERGAQALEWVALGLVVLAIMGAIASSLQGGGATDIANAIKEKIAQMISDM